MITTHSPSDRAQRRTYISNRTRAVESLAKAFAESLDVNALTDLAEAVKDLGRQVEDYRIEVRNALAAATPRTSPQTGVPHG